MEPATKRQRTGEYGKITLRQCTAVLKVLKQLPQAAPFLQPVDPVLMRIPDYPEIVKHPMDLGTIDKKLTDGQYASPRARSLPHRLKKKEGGGSRAPTRAPPTSPRPRPAVGSLTTLTATRTAAPAADTTTSTPLLRTCG